MTSTLALPVAIPVLAAAASVLVGRNRWMQRAISLVALGAVAAVAVRLAYVVDRDGPVTTRAGGWSPPLGIPLYADRFSVGMLIVSVLVLAAVLVYAMGQREEEVRHVGFHPTYLVLTAGVSLSFLTGDLFNLFVGFEVMLLASYVLLTLGGRLAQVRAGMTYVVISLVASALFLTAIAFVYAATGTVELAVLAERFDDLPGGLETALLLLLLGVFGVKAAVFPLFSWLPDSYPTAPTAVTAVFAGLLTKVGVYAIIRIHTLLGPDGGAVPTVLLVVAAATMVTGVLGAIAQNDIKRILSFHIVSQIGYMIFGLGLVTAAGLAAAFLYILHHIIVKTTLFMAGGLVERHRGTAELDRLGGVLRSKPVIAVLFLLPALILAGLPPFSGFIAKFALVDAGLADGAWVVVGVSLAVSALTLFSMHKIWMGAFWGDDERSAPGPTPVSGWMTGSTAVLAASSLVFVVLAGPLHDFASRASVELLDPSLYMRAVGT